MNLDTLFALLGFGTVLSPAVLVSLIGTTMLIGWPLSERAIARSTQTTVSGTLDGHRYFGPHVVYGDS